MTANKQLPEDDRKAYPGVMAHYHNQTNKIDPGPAFQWDLLMQGVRRALRLTAK